MEVRSLGCLCSSVWVSTNHSHSCLSWTTPWSPKPPLFLDWIYSQVLATRDSVLSCGMEWVFAQVWIEECSEVEPTRTHLSPPCLVTSQYLHTPHEWSLSIFICPSGSPSSQGCLSPMHRSLGLGHPVYGSTHSLSIVHLYNLLFPLSPLPGANPDPMLVFPSCPIKCLPIFL